MDGPTSHFYYSQRLRLHYVDWGNPDAPPLLMIHGGRDHCRNWDWVAARLRHRFHIIAPDLPGHGDSAWSIGGGYDLASYVYDVAQLVHQTRTAPVTIMAHSMGAAVALSYTGAFPDHVKQLIAIEGLGPPPEMAAAVADLTIAQRLNQFVLQRRENAGRVPRKYPTIEAAVARMQEENPRLNHEQAHHLTVYGTNQNEDGTYSWKFDNQGRAGPVMGTLLREDQHALWRCITCPVLLARGVESWAADPMTNGTLDYFQNARVVNFEGAGHWVHHDKLDEFLREVDSFLVD